MQAGDGAVKVMRYKGSIRYPFSQETKGSYSVWEDLGH